MRALILLANGFEEIEAFTVIDVLRRAGIEIVSAGLASSVVESAHGVKTIADKRLGEISGEFDMLILPGRPGA